MKIRLAGALVAVLVLAGCAGAQPTATRTPTLNPTIAPSPSPTATSVTTPSPSPGRTPGPFAPPTESPTTSPIASPDTFAWTEVSVADGPPAREDHTFTLAEDGQSAYLYGGRSGNRTFDDIWRYDLAADAWQQLSPEGDVPGGRFGHVTVWKEGVGLVVWSGQADATSFFSDIWAFDPANVAWRRLADNGDVPLARYGSCGGIGPDGRLWISHGFTDDEGRFFDIRAYDFSAQTWTDETPSGDVPVLRCLHDCVWTPDGELLLYAGQTTGAPAIGDMWLYDPAAGAWAQQPRPPAPARQLYALARLDGRAFIFGGANQNGRPLGDMWLLDLATLEMTELAATGAAPAARSGATLVADPQRGRLLLFGGKDASGELADLWILAGQR